MSVKIFRTKNVNGKIVTSQEVFKGTVEQAKAIAGREFNSDPNTIFVGVRVGRMDTRLMLQKDSQGHCIERYSI